MLDIDNLKGYTRIPESLKALRPELVRFEKPDVFGVEDRLTAIVANWPVIAGGRAIDIGGNSGFFSLSLIDRGLISHSTVYDTDIRVLEAGEQMASMMGLSRKISFVEQAVSLSWLQQVDPVDIVIDLNLIHHAGTLFDIQEVQDLGFGEYSRAWLSQTRRISKFCVFGVGFKGTKPANWDQKLTERPKAMIEIATSVGWNLIYEANVQDIADFGVERAKALRSVSQRRHAKRKSDLWRRASSFLRKRVGIGRDQNLSGSLSKRVSYHLFLFQ